MNRTEQREYELGIIEKLIKLQADFVKRHAEESDLADFNSLFSGIYAKLKAFEKLTEREWEHVQRLYYCRVGTFLVDDIKYAFGY